MLSIAGSSTLGRSDLTVSYVVVFDARDIETDQPYHAHATVVGVDAIPGEDGHDENVSEWGIGDCRPSMAPVKGLPLSRSSTFSVSNTALNEDPGNGQNGQPNVDEIKVLVTLTPQVAQVVGPTPSNLVKLPL